MCLCVSKNHTMRSKSHIGNYWTKLFSQYNLLIFNELQFIFQIITTKNKNNFHYAKRLRSGVLIFASSKRT